MQTQKQTQLPEDIAEMQYEDKAFRTYVDLGSDLANEAHTLFGMTTEVGEITDLFKKFHAYGKNFDLLKLKLELGDLLWYVAIMCKLKGFTMKEIQDLNIEKLRIRFPEKFDGHLAITKDASKEEAQLS
jgi:NTP pyrophosphatase (non-canonical NTP hydrolase)